MPSGEPTPACLRCHTPMEPGVIPETGGHGTYARSIWIEGELKVNWLGQPKNEGRQTFYVISYRCPACGYLEAYATDPAS